MLKEAQTRERSLTIGALEVVLVEAVDVDAELDRAIATDQPAPYGVVLWPSAVAISEKLLTLGSLRGERVLDVGTGTGLCALVAAHLGAEVLAVDVIETPLELLNLALQRQLGSPTLLLQTELFDIFSPAPLPEAAIVIFADLLYEEVLARAVGRRTLEALKRGSRVLVGDPERAFRSTFARTLAEAGVPARFEVAYVQLQPDEAPQRCGVLDLEPGMILDLEPGVAASDHALAGRRS